MPPMLGFTILMLLASTYSVATIAWSAALLYLFKAMAHRKPGVRLWNRQLGYFPCNLIFHPELLTEPGQICRRRFGISLLIFIGAAGMSLAIGALAHIVS